MATSHEEKQYDSLSGCLLRLYWVAFGPLIAAGLLWALATSGGGWLTLTDLAFCLVVLSLPLLRWLESRNANALTLDGKPTTAAHLRTYTLAVVLLGLGGWVAAKAIGNYVFVP